jgi:hypothetical protein
LRLRWSGFQEFPGLPGHHGRDDHARGQAENDANAPDSQQPPHQDRCQHAEQSGENQKPGVSPDQSLGLRFDSSKATLHDLVLPPRCQAQPEQADRDTGRGQDEHQPKHGADFVAGDP